MVLVPVESIREDRPFIHRLMAKIHWGWIGKIRLASVYCYSSLWFRAEDFYAQKWIFIT